MEEKKKILYSLMSDRNYTPMKVGELAVLLQVPKEKRPELKQALEALIDEGKIFASKNGRYQRSKKELITGVYRAHPKGFGFVSVEGYDDFYIDKKDKRDAYNGDVVQIAPSLGKHGGVKTEGKIVKILSRGTTRLVGLYQSRKNYGFVLPDDQSFTADVFVAGKDSMEAASGQKVVVELLSYGSERDKPEGKIIEILGKANDPGVDVDSMVVQADVPVAFSEKVMNQVSRISKDIEPSDFEGRVDLRDTLMVTIDGADAKDLDDAISLQKEGNNYVLGVHIADVSNYVVENSALDWSAYDRGTSIYLADRVIPMLPKELSNGICSLNEGVDRLALSCIMTIDEKGKLLSHHLQETVIRVNYRLTYDKVATMLDDMESEARKEATGYISMLEMMKTLALLLKEKRRKRGNIDFDFPETKIILDELGKPIELKPYSRNIATSMIEEFMLMANETVAEEYQFLELPFVYRVHDAPDPDRLKRLTAFLESFGYTIKGGRGEIHPKEIQKLLEKMKGTKEEPLLSRMALRSMKQAVYSTENVGHFGLASTNYCHFTSPIRRYPDLQIHRIIKHVLRGRMKPGRIEAYFDRLPEVAKQCSDRERRAEELEREVLKMKKVEFMAGHEGEQFEGIISSITNWGMYVELPNTVEGLVHVSSMRDDHYDFHERTFEMIGASTGKTYKLGQTVEVLLENTDKQMRTIDFSLV